ncbi:MAG TPA: rhomboid family intramembrane serine protease [Phycisphaerae bacterium]|jgi:membrane associated rhomboid family serine protease|nr:rhomboid family intramembrane serine protease [Phycisphaerae bacterium]HOB75664.1 rhomboid family intramembrane serine protease [Phycisphaerae bacterium]HOJ53276.1 rhomboid family intramembrane serine protease [Phycisphaerae bacterium]HOL27439.1 rhomboid family intramembrane serine protease [Phycisphaerae bacterium]HPP21635.1 rhomboid family intramembrane serine protease [Phycisphaerae bacterium]
MIPISTDTPIRRTPWVNYALIALNVLIFLATGGVENASRPNHPLNRWVELAVLDGTSPQLYQFFTYQFLHANWAHIGGNMLFLWVFGNAVNAKMGHGPYLFFYLAGGVFAATGYGFYRDASMVGASGAIAAVTTAYLALFPRSHITVLYWFFIIGTFELPSMLLIVFKMILWDNVMAPRMVADSNVAFGAHLAGYAFGFAAAAGMLALRCLPRDQFDIVALWRRRLQRHYARVAMADPNVRAQAQFGRVARPVTVDGVTIRPLPDPATDQVTDLRMQIAEALAQNNRDLAAELYEKLLETDPRQVLSRQHQLDIANQLYTMSRLPQAAAAYEKYLTAYPNSPEADAVKLLLGIIYARDLQQYEVAEGHLRASLERLTDERRREQARHWLDVATNALGRPTTEQDS